MCSMGSVLAEDILLSSHPNPNTNLKLNPNPDPIPNPIPNPNPSPNPSSNPNPNPNPNLVQKLSCRQIRNLELRCEARQPGTQASS